MNPRMPDNQCSTRNRSTTFPLDACRTIRRQLSGVKESILNQFGPAAADERLLRLALTEAEALAWQTPYPHLFFPALAEEKAAAARRWTRRQQYLKDTSSIVAFAA